MKLEDVIFVTNDLNFEVPQGAPVAVVYYAKVNDAGLEAFKEALVKAWSLNYFGHDHHVLVAGVRRGVLPLTEWNPEAWGYQHLSPAERDDAVLNGINPIKYVAGQGLAIWGGDAWFGGRKVQEGAMWSKLLHYGVEPPEQIVVKADSVDEPTRKNKMQAMKTIYVTFQRKGLHRYPGAPNEVNYLALEHRHLFKFKVQIEVFHDDREIEFHMFLNWIESLYDQGIMELNHKSCEMISDELAEKIANKYPNRYMMIEVSEDGECGSICYYNKERLFK